MIISFIFNLFPLAPINNFSSMLPSSLIHYIPNQTFSFHGTSIFNQTIITWKVALQDINDQDSSVSCLLLPSEIPLTLLLPLSICATYSSIYLLLCFCFSCHQCALWILIPPYLFCLLCFKKFNCLTFWLLLSFFVVPVLLKN